MTSLENSVAELDRVVNRYLLTDMEVQLTNEVIRLKEEIKLYKKVVGMIDNYIHLNNLYSEKIDYDFEDNPYVLYTTDEDAVRDLEQIIGIVKKEGDSDV